jgi:hypothetical protein
VKRRLFTPAAALSLLLCATMLVLWTRSNYREAHWSWMSGDERHTLRSFRGRLTLFLPPPAVERTVSAPDGDQQLRQILGFDPEWTIRCVDEGGSFFREGISRAEGGYVYPGRYPRDFRAASPPLSQLARPLLRALENRERAVKAHVALCILYGGDGDLTVQREPVRVGGAYTATLDGLPVTLHPSGKFRPHSLWIMYPSSAQVDPVNLPAIRDQWHRRLDVSRWSVDYRPLAAVTAILPLAWILFELGQRWRRRRRWLSNQCRSCGYDLRESPDRCPECGTRVPHTQEAAA